MVLYYFFTIFVSFFYLLDKKLSLYILFVGCCFFLWYLPSINFFGPDYPGYLNCYENAYTISNFPWYVSASVLVSEGFYVWLNASFAIITGFKFPFFLVANFLASFLLSLYILKDFKKDFKYLFWLMILPVIFPTIFYYLIRSSLSFFFTLVAFMVLVNFPKKRAGLFAIFSMFIAINIHSQYMLISILFIFMFYFLKLDDESAFNNNLKKVYIVSIILYLFLFLINNFIDVLTSLFSYLPSAEVAIVKLGYFENSREGFRLTGLLSILAYPYMAYKVLYTVHETQYTLLLNDKVKEKKMMFLIFTIILFGAVINLAFINNPHVAGRLSRFSDYLGMVMLMPFYFKIQLYNKEKIFLIIITLLAPILYAAVYMNTNWGIY